jgi:hypothetical protein
MKLPSTPDDGFYREILRGIGAPVTDNTLALIYAWRQTEGGKAAYNPFNTTHKLPGSTLYGTNKHGVQNYATPRDGVRATVTTMTNGKYDSILALLQSDAAPEDVAKAIIASPWGTKGLLLEVLAMYARGKFVVSPITVPAGGLPASSAEVTISNAPAAASTPAKTEAAKTSPVLTALKWGIAACFGGIAVTLALRQRAMKRKQMLRQNRWH